MPPLTTDLLNYITQRLVIALQPEQISLIGSYAYGEPNERKQNVVSSLVCQAL